MPPAYEVLLLNTAVPQIQAAQSGDTYVVPRAIAFNAGVNVVNNDVTIYGVTVGRGAGAVSTNTVLGSGALAANVSAGGSVAIGFEALKAMTTGDNCAVGYQALLANDTGQLNSAFGAFSLKDNLSGNYNTAYGRDSLKSNTTASNNTAVGYQAGYSNQTGANLVALGYQAGYSSNADNNTFIGYYAGQGTTGTRNTFVGVNGAGYLVTSGTKNTIIGGYSGYTVGGLDIRTASNYIVLSDGDGNIGFSTVKAGGNQYSWALPGAENWQGTGITFPATQNASSNANTLDDYEEGTWTPAISGLTLGNGTASGQYTKVGDSVSVQFKITLGSTSSVTSLTTLSGLPFSISGFVSSYVDILDSGTIQYSAVVSAYTSASTADIRGLRSNGTYVDSYIMSTNDPMTWTDGDCITASFTYKAS